VRVGALCHRRGLSTQETARRERIDWCDPHINAHIKDDAQAKAPTDLMGVGPVTASEVVATVGDFKVSFWQTHLAC
jgi:hypothetical protein